jgi:hypothetical protein
MADDKKPTDAVKTDASKANTKSDASGEVKLEQKLTEVGGDTNMVVGDENAPDAGEYQVEVVQEDARAYNMRDEDRSVDTVPVNEVYVQTDVVDLDGPVVVPDAGRGSLDLPAHALLDGSVEDKFAAGENDEEDRALVGTSPEENDPSKRKS